MPYDRSPVVEIELAPFPSTLTLRPMPPTPPSPPTAIDRLLPDSPANEPFTLKPPLPPPPPTLCAWIPAESAPLVTIHALLVTFTCSASPPLPPLPPTEAEMLFTSFPLTPVAL